MDKRFFLALVLSLMVIAVTQMLFPSAKRPVVQPPVIATSTAATITSTAPSPGTVPGNAVAPSAGGDGVSASPVRAQIAPQNATITTAKAIFTLTNVGAELSSVVMKDYRSSAHAGQPVELAVTGKRLLSFKLVLPTDTIPLGNVAFTQHSDSTGKSVRYDAVVKNIPLSVIYSEGADPYVLQATARLGAGGSGAFLVTALPTTLKSAEADTLMDHGSLAYAFKLKNDHPRSVLFAKLDPGESRLEPGPLEWVAVKSKYFVFGILAREKKSSFAEVTFTGGPRTSKIPTNAAASLVQKESDGQFGFDIYAGPQESQRLMSLGRDFDQVNPYGWSFLQPVVHPIASLVIRMLLWMHNVLQLGYGWVLVILGIAIRLLLWPLNQTTMRSSLKMQAIQPKLAAVQKKYKDNPEKQREAIMKVYQEEGVNPLAGLAGCLPALLPMPIFFALFFVFQNTIEFRGVPFLWLHDISVKDPFYILPLLMGVSMYVLSWIGMRASPPNPQAKMMGYMFPVMMTAFLLNMASGLNLYYTAQNIAALPQQWLLARERARRAVA
ncbi:MAG: membrane protein insertase YidC [Gemmatimonadaceae bacterium]|nr:membrane protein insertase YidC [Gemmatimonadaceae bacterium]